MIKECPTCEIEFESNNLSQKYCSKECRLSMVRENDRLRKQKEREKERILRIEEYERIQQDKREAREVAEQERLKLADQEHQKLIDEAEKGDPLAQMQLSKPQSFEYWEAYRQYQIEYAENWNRESRVIVNNISVNDPDFSEKVIITTQELGYIKTDRY